MNPFHCTLKFWNQNPNYITAKKNLEVALSQTPRSYNDIIEDTPESTI